MKIKSNDPIWKDVYSQSKLPASLEGLKEMSTNLWWVWNHEGAKLFGKIDPALWKKTEGNPVQLLQNLSFQRTEEILADKELMAEITKVYADFKAYMNVKPDQTNLPTGYYQYTSAYSWGTDLHHLQDHSMLPLYVEPPCGSLYNLHLYLL